MDKLPDLSVSEARALITARIAESKVNPATFIDRFCYTFDPKRDPYHLEFRLFPFQFDLVKEVQLAIDNGYDLFIEKCREMGATYTLVDVFLWYWLYVPGSNFLMGSRKEDYVDNTKASSVGGSNKEESLFGKLEYTINRLPAFMLPKGFDSTKHMTYMSLINPELGNVISGESSNPNFSRGGRQKAILMDEFAFWDNDSQAWGSTADTSNCRIVLTTPGIRPSKAKRLRFGVDGEKIKVITLEYSLDPRKTQEWLDQQRERRSAEDFAREIMINWEASLSGIVYPEIKQAVTGNYPYNPQWPLYMAWDFGADGMALQWWQPNKDNGLMRLIDAYSNTDKPIHFYFPFVGKPIDSTYQYSVEDIEAIEAVKSFKKAVHFGDPDVSKRSIASSVMTSVRQELQKIGVYVQTKPLANDFVSRREKTKVMLQKGIEVNKTKGTDYWMESILNARYPQRLETSQSTTPIVLPIHDWTSHHRTATEYLAVNYTEERVVKPQTTFGGIKRIYEDIPG